MEKNKKVLIFLGIIVLVIAIYFICFHRGTTEENKKTLTLAEEITLNNNEKELLSELVNVNNKLLNPTQEENANTTDYTKIVKPREPTSLRDFCIKLYEARKTTNDEEETIYLFEMETKGKSEETVRRIFVTKNGELAGCTFIESDYAENLEQMDNTTVNENGKVTLLKEGTVTINAISKDNNSISASHTIVIK